MTTNLQRLAQTEAEGDKRRIAELEEEVELMPTPIVHTATAANTRLLAEVPEMVDLLYGFIRLCRDRQIPTTDLPERAEDLLERLARE